MTTLGVSPCGRAKCEKFGSSTTIGSQHLAKRTTRQDNLPGRLVSGMIVTKTCYLLEAGSTSQP
jgi:hypothetical protein